MDTEDLESILSNEPTTEAPEAPEAETIGRPRDEHGRFVSASDPGDETPEAPAPEAAPPAAQQEAEPSHIPVAALRDERQKRQQAEERLRWYEQQQLAPQQQHQEPAEIPDVFTDPVAYTQWVAQQVRESVMQEVQQFGGQFGTQTRAEVSEMLARRQYEDYDSVIEASFKPAVAANPFLVQQMAQSPDPAGFAYKAGKQWAEAQKYGQAEPLSREQIEAEIRQKIMAELNLSQSQQAPNSLATERSVGSRPGPAWSGPADLGELLR